MKTPLCSIRCNFVTLLYLKISEIECHAQRVLHTAARLHTVHRIFLNTRAKQLFAKPLHILKTDLKYTQNTDVYWVAKGRFVCNIIDCPRVEKNMEKKMQ